LAVLGGATVVDR